MSCIRGSPAGSGSNDFSMVPLIAVLSVLLSIARSSFRTVRAVMAHRRLMSSGEQIVLFNVWSLNKALFYLLQCWGTYWAKHNCDVLRTVLFINCSPMLNLEGRMGEALAKSGASVTVTSITDVLCFAVGLISNMPVVQLFCLYTSVALTIDFIYQVHLCS